MAHTGRQKITVLSVLFTRKDGHIKTRHLPWPETEWPEPELPGLKPQVLCVPHRLHGTVNHKTTKNVLKQIDSSLFTEWGILWSPLVCVFKYFFVKTVKLSHAHTHTQICVTMHFKGSVTGSTPLHWLTFTR